jgi:uncharacterized repeat protein (TIGR03803 family)
VVGDHTFDEASNIYGTTPSGGTGTLCQQGAQYGCGVVFKLTHSSDGWTESVIYSFTGGSDGAFPFAGVVLDHSGNIYGTTYSGGTGTLCYNGQINECGVVFKLTPSSGGWTESVIHDFSGGSDGGSPEGGLIFDQEGNLYGTTEGGGLGNGTVFSLTPSEGAWTLNTLYSFPGPGVAGPTAALAQDTMGNLFGTSMSAYPDPNGGLFELSPSNGSWTYTLLYSFTGGFDGSSPYGQAILDGNGNLYGATFGGGQYGFGTVFQFIPF